MSRIKYPRSMHLPWSLGLTDDDRRIESLDRLLNAQEVVVTEKRDGENTSLYRDGLHARSLDSGTHPSRDWLKRWHAGFANEIPEGMRICGENLFAKHSIHYRQLPALFEAFSVWEGERCLSWDETETWCQLLDIRMVPVLYRGPWNEKIIRTLWESKSQSGDEMEGYVVRVTDSFMLSEFSQCLGKFVRANHVQTSEHWKNLQMVRNEAS